MRTRAAMLLALLSAVQADVVPGWCNAYTCGVSVCNGQPECQALAEGAYCSWWCNAYTCSDTYCRGCSICDALEHKTVCAHWCNTFTCDAQHCGGCSYCYEVLANKYCASWCNSYTCHDYFAHCQGCADCAKRQFNRISTFKSCQQIDTSCNTNTETLAEIAAASADGNTIIYTDS